MELPSTREQKRDFRKWKHELRVSDSDEEGEYIAPNRRERFGRLFHDWFDTFESKRGPLIEYFVTSEPGRQKEMVDQPEEDDEGLTSI